MGVRPGLVDGSPPEVDNCLAQSTTVVPQIHYYYFFKITGILVYPQTSSNQTTLSIINYTKWGIPKNSPEMAISIRKRTLNHGIFDTQKDRFPND
jgi:hypothetical protein